MIRLVAWAVLFQVGYLLVLASIHGPSSLAWIAAFLLWPTFLLAKLSTAFSVFHGFTWVSVPTCLLFQFLYFGLLERVVPSFWQGRPGPPLQTVPGSSER